MLPAAELTRSVCQSCVSLSGLWVLATPLPELLVLLPVFLPYSLTLEVAKVDSLFSLVVLQTSCSSLEPVLLPHPISLQKISFAQSSLHALGLL